MVPQLKWVMNPGNPNQIDEELVMHILAMYVAVIRSVGGAQGRSGI